MKKISQAMEKALVRFLNDNRLLQSNFNLNDHTARALERRGLIVKGPVLRCGVYADYPVTLWVLTRKGEKIGVEILRRERSEATA